MANYGMDYQGDMGGGNFGGGGGGFNAGGGGFGASQGGGGGSPPARTRRSYDEQTLVPVTARMILQAQASSNAEGSGSVTLPDGRHLYQVKLVGAVRTVEEASTNVFYNIEDGTGLVEVKQWLDDNDASAVVEMRQECSREHIYVKVIGQIKDYDGKKTLVADSVRKLATSNELTYHMLEVVYSAEKYQRKESIGGTANMAPAPGGVGFPMVGSGGGVPIGQFSGSGGGGGDELRDAVLGFIRTEGERTEVGAPVDECVRRLTAGGRYDAAQIRQAIDNLSSEGHIYSTINEDHYKFAM